MSFSDHADGRIGAALRTVPTQAAVDPQPISSGSSFSPV